MEFLNAQLDGPLWSVVPRSQKDKYCEPRKGSNALLLKSQKISMEKS